MKKVFCLLLLISLAVFTGAARAHGDAVYGWHVGLTGCVSGETGRAPVAYMWLPEGCKEVRAVLLAQQNMTEEALFRMASFRQRLTEMGVGLVWVAPAFTDNWAPADSCQAVFNGMMAGLAEASGHGEIARVPVVPFGHSAQATFPWNFAAWNPQRTLCIISFHGDAPRTNLCGYGGANVEWGRTRNIDGIPGLMIEGEYEWWEARVRPALAFRMMYPGSCVSFLCDTGRGHFDCSPRTAEYIALFIKKAIEQRMNADGSRGEKIENLVEGQDGYENSILKDGVLTPTELTASDSDGSFILVYQARDLAGNESDPVEVVIKVVEGTPDYAANPWNDFFVTALIVIACLAGTGIIILIFVKPKERELR